MEGNWRNEANKTFLQIVRTELFILVTPIMSAGV